MINVSQQRALLQRIMAECDRLARERTSQADQYTDGYLDALGRIESYCDRLDRNMWKP
ncbi:MAG: hypothetical protein HFJ39_08895 [Bifidobacterium pseudolongum]|nr:hypothetical protein [Bifidobacterium pseudolongum]